MVIQEQIETTLSHLYTDAKYDHLKMMKSIAKNIFRPLKPFDFKDVYLSISQEEGKEICRIIKENMLKNIVEFGTSFGISTLFLAQGVLETGGHIISTELIESKAHKAIENFKRAGVNDLIEVRIGDALETLKHHTEPIDFLFLDGWKDLYLPLFKMLEPLFHSGTIIYADNMNMGGTRAYADYVLGKTPAYITQAISNAKAFLTFVS